MNSCCVCVYRRTLGVFHVASDAKCAIAHWRHQVLNVIPGVGNVRVCLELLDKCVKFVSTATGIMDLLDALVCFSTVGLFSISSFSERKLRLLNLWKKPSFNFFFRKFSVANSFFNGSLAEEC